MRPVPTDFAAYRRARWHARLVTAAAVVVVGYLAVQVVLRAVSDDALLRASAAWFSLWLGVVGIGAWRALDRVWRRSYRLRPVVQQLHRTPGEIYGIPGLDEETPRHRGLSGEDRPPTRW